MSALRALLLAACAGSVAFAANPPYEIGTWRGFKTAAVSYTFDDGCSNQFSIAVPMFNDQGFKLTLFTVINTMFPGWPKLQSAAAAGHEIASHTMTHANLSTLSDAQQVTELMNSRDAINANISGQRYVTMAYPYCAEGKDALTAQYYIAARTCSGQLVPSTPANFMNISSFVCGSQGSVQTAQDFTNRANSALGAKSWCVYLIHGLDNDGGYSPLPSATLRASVKHLGANQDKFWVEAFGNVARYILERDAASVSEIASNSSTISVRVTDTLDNAVFNYPITLRRPLPVNWPGATVTQNGKRVPGEVVLISGTRYVMFDVVPDGGDVTIAKEVQPIRLSNPGRSSPTSFNFRLEGQIGVPYAILASSNLVEWSPVQTNTLLAAFTNVAVPASNSLQFYRAELAL